MCLRNSSWLLGLPGRRTRWAPPCSCPSCWRHKQRRVLSSPFACLHTAGRLYPYLLLLGLERTGGAEGEMVFPLNSISRGTTYSKFPDHWAHINVRPLNFPFLEMDHLEKRQVTIPMDKLVVFSIASPWLDWSLQFVSKLIQNLPLKCSRHYRGVVHAPLGSNLPDLTWFGHHSGVFAQRDKRIIRT